MNRIFPSVLVLVFFSAFVVGQDSTEVNQEGYVPLLPSDTVYEVYDGDTITQYRTGVRVMGDTSMVEANIDHSPRKAIMYALVLPGLGQGYNRKFFKMPIVWAALGGAGYAISFTTKQYKFYSKEFANDPDGANNEDYLRWSRRNMELSYIALIVVYALQVLDAYVDAQLYYWNVNEELSMGISPSLQPLMAPGGVTGQAFGLTCSFNFRK
jgi:hypothetical protein